MDFERRYLERIGPTAPAITSPGESCFEGLTLLSRLVDAARSTEVTSIDGVSGSIAYEGPRGVVRMRDRHLLQRIYLARADGLEFDVLAEINAGG
jgi:urea transport system substrate-binding protein